MLGCFETIDLSFFFAGSVIFHITGNVSKAFVFKHNKTKFWTDKRRKCHSFDMFLNYFQLAAKNKNMLQSFKLKILCYKKKMKAHIYVCKWCKAVWLSDLCSTSLGNLQLNRTSIIISLFWSIYQTKCFKFQDFAGHCPMCKSYFNFCCTVFTIVKLSRKYRLLYSIVFLTYLSLP